MKRFLLKSSTVFLLLVIAGCGFHLRGSATLPVSLQTMYVQGVNMKQGLGLELKRGLTRNGVTVRNEYQQGTAVLTILDNRFQRRVLSVGSDAKVSEYELHGSVTFKVSDGDGKVLADSQTVEARRDYQFDQNQVLGKDEEERLLKEQLNQQLVQSILRRLSVL
ncbi:MAG: LPS assembly lipoprotein LptE [Gammaproteobacteria bacterium]|nr:LPS assembly lipoprotein LptE [Gammaproteobacteria bacterium]